MSRNLPALPVPAEIEPGRPTRRARGLQSAGPSQGLRRWLQSPLTRALADIAPELLRAARTHGESRPLADLPPAGANGLTVSEIEVALSTPFVRRVIVRSATAWSVAPEVVLAERSKKHRARRLGLGAAGLAGLAMLGVAAGRRALPSLLSLPDRSQDS